MPEQKSQLSLARDEFQQYLRKSVEGARALRDELKLQAQLGTEEARGHWGDLERYLAHLDGLAHDLNQAAGAFGEQVLEIVRRAGPQRKPKAAAKRSPKSVAKRTAKRGAKRGAKRSAKKRDPKKPSRR